MSKQFFTEPNTNDSIRRYYAILAWMMSSAKIVKGVGTPDEKIIEMPVIITGNQIYYKSQRLEESQGTKYATSLPRAAIKFNSLNRDTEQQINRHNTLVSKRRSTGANSSTMKKPYTFNFECNCRLKTRSEAYQLIELVAAKFDPYVGVKLRDNRKLDVYQTITISLLDIRYDDDWGTADFEDGRDILVGFDFVINGNLYDAIDEPSIIESIHHQLTITNTGDTYNDWIVVSED